MTSQGSAHGRFQRAISSPDLQNAEMAACEMGELLAATDPKRYKRAALGSLQRFIDERLPPLTELRHGRRAVEGRR